MAISIAFSRFLPEFQSGSVISRGLSANRLSCCDSLASLSSSIACAPFSPSPSLATSFRPLAIGLRALGVASRDVIAYSHSFVAMSQSSTVPSLPIGFRICIPARGRCTALSPNTNPCESVLP